MSGRKSRNKGKRGEREVVNILKANDVPAKRISPMEAGGEDKGDILVAEVWKGEVKLGSHVPKFMFDVKGESEMLFIRRNRRKWMVCMDLDFFLKNFI